MKGCVRLPVLALVASSVLACEHQDRPKVASPPPPITERTGYALMLADACPMTPPVAGQEAAPLAAAVAGIVGPIIVDKAMSAGAAYLKRREDEKSGTATMLTHATLKPGGALPGCVIIVHGTYGDNPSVTPEPQGDGRFDENFFKTDFVANQLHLIAPPDFYLELQLDYSPPQTVLAGKGGKEEAVLAPHFRLHPTFLHYGRTSAKREGSGTKALFVDFEAGGYASTAAGSPRIDLGKITLPLEERTIGQRYNAPAFYHLTSPTMMIPPVKLEDKSGGTVIPVLHALDVKVTLTETEDKNDWVLAAADIVDSGREDVRKLVKEEIDRRLGKKDE